MKLRTFEGEPVRGEMATDFPISQDGLPVLLVNDEPFSPEEAEFFIEYAAQEELEKLDVGGCVRSGSIPPCIFISAPELNRSLNPL